MSVPFTITANNWQETVEELRLAFSERSFVVAGEYKKFIFQDSEWKWVEGDGTVADLLGADGKAVNLQVEYFWSDIQLGIEDFTYQWVPVSGTSMINISDTGTSFPTGSWDLYSDPWKSFCSIVGGILWVDTNNWGWPRVTPDTEKDEEGDYIYERGEFIIGDYIGPWIIESIILAFENLKAFEPYSSLIYMEGAADRQGEFIPATSFFESSETETNFNVLFEVLLNNNSTPTTSAPSSSFGVAFNPAISCEITGTAPAPIFYGVRKLFGSPWVTNEITAKIHVDPSISDFFVSADYYLYRTAQSNSDLYSYGYAPTEYRRLYQDQSAGGETGSYGNKTLSALNIPSLFEGLNGPFFDSYGFKSVSLFDFTNA